MLEGLEVSEIDFSNTKEEYCRLRLDAEYFKKEFMNLSYQIKQSSFLKISDFAYVTDGIHESIDFNPLSEINLISAKSPKENYFDLSSNHYISRKQHELNSRTRIREYDVIVSTVGTIGNCAVARKKILPANSDRHVGIIRVEKDIQPYVLSTFILSKFGRFQTLRESTGNVQLNLFIYKINEILVPKFSNPFQDQITNLCSASYEKRINSTEVYGKAEQLLLSEIGIENFEPSKEPVNIKSFKESFLSSKRLDAEYYQKKYEEIVALISDQNHDVLENLVTIKKSIEPGSVNYSEEGLPFLRVSDYNEFGLSDPDKYLSNDFVKENKTIIDVLKPKVGTILFSKDGSVGTAFHLREDQNLITSGAILHLRVKDEKRIVPNYLSLVLNSIATKMQAERDAGGSIILHWRVSEIENLLVPVIDFSKQEKIAQLITESFVLRKQSEHLLEVAKRAVEIAIEESEEGALVFINQQTNQ